MIENQLSGSPQSEWDIYGVGDISIQGFATDISVNRGGQIEFKINNSDLAPYRIDIYRIGYYQGLGARKVATIPAENTLRHAQPAPLFDANTGLVDAGNWSVSASWSVPHSATSGVYIAKPVREDTGGASHIIFVVRDDDGYSDLLFQTSDTSWQAYNSWGGNSLYTGSPGTDPGRAYAVSYNRPFNTRGVTPKDWFFSSEYAMVRWIEANGYDVSYTTGVDSDRRGEEILEHKIFLSVGHDEYWSGTQRANVEAARDAGVHLAFFSGNEVYWKTRWEPSIDGTTTDYRTLVSYKESMNGNDIDPGEEWTGTWRDPTSKEAVDGGRPENSLTGQLFTVNRGPGGETGTSLEVPAEYNNLRFWRNTRVSSLAPGETAILGDQVLGYEWDEDIDNGYRPAGLVRMSSTTQNSSSYLASGYGALKDFVSGTATHSLTLYRASSGAIVFGAGTVQWSWGLDGIHDVVQTTPDLAMQQATANLFVDMGVYPETPHQNLVIDSISTDVLPPISTITSPESGTTVSTGTPITITGVASDPNNGVVSGVEVSTDDGRTWKRADGRSNWTYTWTPKSPGNATILSRSVDDSGNIETEFEPLELVVSLQPTLTDGLVASYSFDHREGNRLEDQSGFGNHGTLNGPEWIDGFYGHALKFDGIDDLVTIPHTSALDLVAGMTLSAWVKPESANKWASVVTKQRSTDLAYAMYSSSLPEKSPLGYLTAKPPASGPPLPLNAWSHLATTYDGEDLKFYVNGFETGSQEIQDSIWNSKDHLTIGGNTVYQDQYYEGLIDELRIYNRPLTPAEIAYDMSTGINGLPDTVPPTITVQLTSDPVNAPNIVTLTAISSDNTSVAEIEFFLNDRPLGEIGYGSTHHVDWDTRKYPNKNHTIRAVARDFTGNSSISDTITVLVNNPDDAIAPITYFTYPRPMQSVSGIDLLSAFASDDSGIESVEFSAGGTQLSAPVTITPYLTTWDSKSLPDGPTDILLTARDFSGNETYKTITINIDNTPPKVVSTNIETNGNYQPLEREISILFSEAIKNHGYRFSLVEKSGNIVRGTITYDPSNYKLSFLPEQKLIPNEEYTAVIEQVSDVAGNLLATPYRQTFRTIPTIINTSIWDDASTPSTESMPDFRAIELGLKFEVNLDGYIHGIRFYKGPLNTGNHQATLWTENGTPLARAVNEDGTTSGWQDVHFSEPVPISKGKTYVASYFAPNGGYAADPQFFQSDMISGAFKIPAASSSGGNGVYMYSDSSSFPSETYNATNYWVDVIFSNTIADVQPPKITNTIPVPNSQDIDLNSKISASFDESINHKATEFTLIDQAGTLIADTFNYEPDTSTISLNLTSLPHPNTIYIANISNVVDLSGNKMDSLSWEFKTGGPDTSPPVILKTFPSLGETDVSLTAKITAIVDEKIDLSSVSAKLTNDLGATVASSVFYDSTQNTITIRPMPENIGAGCCGACIHCTLAPLTGFTVQLAGVSDLAGNIMPDYQWSFSTTSEITNASIWDQNAIPEASITNDTSPVELGVKVRIEQDGFINGLRVFKGLESEPPQLGRLWDLSGNVLGTLSFERDTQTGWFEAYFGSPIFVTTGTTYIASYYAPNGRYFYTNDYFSGNDVVRGPLTALANSVAGKNGVFRYGEEGGFPTSTYNSTNYWVDVIYSNSLQQTTIPSISERNPSPDSTNNSIQTTIQATFNVDIDPTSIQFKVHDIQLQTIESKIIYDALNRSITLYPLTTLQQNSVYTVELSNIEDRLGNKLPTSNWKFETGAAAINKSIWSNNDIPENLFVNESQPVEVGMKFQSKQNGYITGIRFYQGKANNGLKRGHLWSSDGQLLAEGSAVDASGVGWQNIYFNKAVPISENTTYVSSYFAPNGGYSVDQGFFKNGYENDFLKALSSSEGNGNGVFRYGPSSFPDQSYNDSNYWVDVLFSEILVDVTPPYITSISPDDDITGVNSDTQVVAIFNEPVIPSSVSAALIDLDGNRVPLQQQYDVSSRSITLTPFSPLESLTTYNVVITGAVDASGNAMSSFSSSFSTIGYWSTTETQGFASGFHQGTSESNIESTSLTLATIFEDNFDSTDAEIRNWTTHTYSDDGSIKVANSLLSVANGNVTSKVSYTTESIAGRIKFGTSPHQHFGLATGLNHLRENYWAIFSTDTFGNKLIARVNAMGFTEEIELGPLTNEFRNYAIRQTKEGFAFYINGDLQVILGRPFSSEIPLRITLSSYGLLSPYAELLADGIKILDASGQLNEEGYYVGIYESDPIDAKISAIWRTTDWTASLPSMTTLKLEIMVFESASSETTEWTDITDYKNLLFLGLKGRYLRYRITLTSELPNESPELFELSFTWT